MRLTLGLLGLLASSAAAKTVARTEREFRDGDFVIGAYVVEFAGDEDHESFYGTLRAEGLEVGHRMELRHELFNGASFKIRNHKNPEIVARDIAKRSDTKNIWPVRRLRFPKITPLSVGDGNLLESKSNRLSDAVTVTNDPTHVQTQVDKLRAEGYTGKGIKVGIVDSGIDYKNPALGGCFGEGCLVSFGWDLVGNVVPEDDEEYIPDDDPWEGCFGHGTHVAGIVAAQPNKYGFTEVAPGADIGMFKCSAGCGGSTSTDVLIAGLNRAYEAGSDIISISAGNTANWAQDPWALVASRIVEKGVPVLAAAGNSGYYGLFQASAPSVGKDVAAIGSTDNINIPIILSESTFRVNNGTEETFGWISGNPALPTNSSVGLSLWAMLDENEACTPLSEDTPDLSDKIALIHLRETDDCTPKDQCLNIAEKGGKHVLFYTSSNSTTMEAYGDAVKAVGTVTPHQASSWLHSLSQAKEIVVDLHLGKSYVEQTKNDESPGAYSFFSSWGPTWDMHDLKPTFGGPGGYYLSTWPMSEGGVAVLSGTSMATPHLAGVYALLAEARGTNNPNELRSILAATAKPTKWFDGREIGKQFAPVVQQGSGEIRSYDAAHLKVVPSKTSFSLGDSDHFEGNQTFTLKNTGEEDATFFLAHLKAPTTYHFQPGTRVTAVFPPAIVDDGAEVDFESTEVVVPAGGKANVTFSVIPPSHLDEKILPNYGGYIKLTSPDAPTLTIPFFGIIGSLYDTPVLLREDIKYVSASDLDTEIPANRTFVIPRPAESEDPEELYGIGPVANIQFMMGSALLRVDVVPLGDVDMPTKNWLGYKTVGQVPSYPREWVTSQSLFRPFVGMTADGGIVPKGSYRFVLSAVRVYGDEEKEDDWDVVELPAFNIQYEEA